jgi:hypothetical protein
VRLGPSVQGRRPDGLIDNWAEGPKPRLSAVGRVREAGPDREKDGVVRWRRVDLKGVIAQRFGVEFQSVYVGKLLKSSASRTSAQGRVTLSLKSDLHHNR